MIFTPTKLAGSYTITLEPFQDSRGWFARYFCKNEFAKIGHAKEWVQMNHSATVTPGTIRGMHFQLPPHSEIKLVRCIRGAVYDVIIDLRKDSPSFLQYFGTELSAENKNSLYIPEGFAHGFQSLEPNSELIYHHSNFYEPHVESGIRFDDPRVNIKWPLALAEISQRDANHSYLGSTFNGI